MLVSTVRRNKLEQQMENLSSISKTFPLIKLFKSADNFIIILATLSIFLNFNIN